MELDGSYISTNFESRLKYLEERIKDNAPLASLSERISVVESKLTQMAENISLINLINGVYRNADFQRNSSDDRMKASYNPFLEVNSPKDGEINPMAPEPALEDKQGQSTAVQFEKVAKDLLEVKYDVFLIKGELNNIAVDCRQDSKTIAQTTAAHYVQTYFNKLQQVLSETNAKNGLTVSEDLRNGNNPHPHHGPSDSVEQVGTEVASGSISKYYDNYLPDDRYLPKDSIIQQYSVEDSAHNLLITSGSLHEDRETPAPGGNDDIFEEERKQEITEAGEDMKYLDHHSNTEALLLKSERLLESNRVRFQLDAPLSLHSKDGADKTTNAQSLNRLIQTKSKKTDVIVTKYPIVPVPTGEPYPSQTNSSNQYVHQYPERLFTNALNKEDAASTHRLLTLITEINRMAEVGRADSTRSQESPRRVGGSGRVGAVYPSDRVTRVQGLTPRRSPSPLLKRRGKSHGLGISTVGWEGVSVNGTGTGGSASRQKAHDQAEQQALKDLLPLVSPIANRSTVASPGKLNMQISVIHVHIIQLTVCFPWSPTHLPLPLQNV